MLLSGLIKWCEGGHKFVFLEKPFIWCLSQNKYPCGYIQESLAKWKKVCVCVWERQRERERVWEQLGNFVLKDKSSEKKLEPATFFFFFL